MQRGIYKIHNLVNGNFYIGGTVNWRKRQNTHKYQLRRGTHHSIILQRAWDKYGEDAFIFEPLESLADSTDEHLILREQHYLGTLKPKYNVAKIAGRFVHTDEWRKRVCETNSARVWTSEMRSSMAKKSGARTYARRAVLQFDLDGNFIKETTFSDIKLEFNTHTNVVCCCQGKRRTAYGFIWKYGPEK